MNDKTYKYIERGFSKKPNSASAFSKNELYSCSKMAVCPFIEVPQSCCCSVFSDTSSTVVEIRFKNNRKEFYSLSHEIKVVEGDILAVESSSGHDIGIVTLVGYLALLQMKTKKVTTKIKDLKKVYRKAKVSDIETWIQSIELEKKTMKQAKELINDIGLQMRLNDVEYQGDKTKAIFYYTSEERIDFRELIKVLGREFRIRVEMKQIGARQESAKIGGIGPCGRGLCCSSWINDFKSVSTNSARVQQLILNPQKLAGHCTKLKCCLNYEYPVYVEELEKFPDASIELKTKSGEAVYIKSDVFENLMWYAYKQNRANLFAISIKAVETIIALNKNGKIPDSLDEFAKKTIGNVETDNISEQDDINKL